MLYNYTGVDSDMLSAQGVASAIESDLAAVRGLEAGLRASFTGEAAETGWQPKITELMKRVDDCVLALTNWKNTVQSVAGNGGAMHDTDRAQGARFQSIAI